MREGNAGAPPAHCRSLSQPCSSHHSQGLGKPGLVWRKSALKLFHQLLRGGGATAGTGAAENSWESAKSQQAQDVDGQQLNSFTEMT